MKKIIAMTALSLCVVSLAACGGKSDAEKAAKDAGAKVEKVVTDNGGNAKVTGYTKAQYMKACKTSMTEAQCECYVDFYKSIGLEVTELGDQAKVTAAVQNMKPEKAMEMSKCLQ